MNHEIHKVLGRNRGGGRRAMSLVEVTVAVAVVFVLFATITTLVVRLRQWDRRVRGHGLRGDQIAALAERMRGDIRRASSLVLTTKRVITIRDPSQQETRYELHSDECRRVVKLPGDASSKIESYVIGPADSWKFEEDVSGRHLAYKVMLMRPESKEITTRSVPLFIYAALGADLPVN